MISQWGFLSSGDSTSFALPVGLVLSLRAVRDGMFAFWQHASRDASEELMRGFALHVQDAMLILKEVLWVCEGCYLFYGRSVRIVQVAQAVMQDLAGPADDGQRLARGAPPDSLS